MYELQVQIDTAAKVASLENGAAGAATDASMQLALSPSAVHIVSDI